MGAHKRELTWAREEVDGWLTLKLRTGRCSALLRSQLAIHMVARIYHVHAILDEIAKLEGLDTQPSGTKSAAPFRRAPLVGLWHKHHFQPALMARNLALHWSSQSGRARFRALTDRMGGDLDISQLAHEFVLAGYQERAAASALTGQWIVYAPCEGRNYYLTLGRHGYDDVIRRCVERCYVEFPELRVALRSAI